ncbi:MULTISPECIES: hypothetical protein [Streptomyces]|uniref:Secreted protein n=1 Tax=Streptomyces clavifer TaxID=68188 RepID=A0ABS4V8C3_9ACTN|nr:MULTISPECIES: hypothetical protein [Streptomyces]KQX78038.1 hypothetical protein ASD26_17840 [Streptomyces sp. Root1319]KQZ10070.1 hypothetical protein ASD51_07215 [Streptomyces sp. Root55]MBP2360092.1 hypothetical protein [Streptomyces clavifer]MDX2743252.1 hypothetical protein [Streptomyces sp. NRRL_B-2557]MDX3064522.1 hypothetical protein [Streptomyces sp. ND04-05B]
MRIRIGVVVLAVVLLIAAFVSSIPSEAETEAACRRALDNTSTATNRPDVCLDVPAETYRAFLLMYVLRAEGLD